MGPSDFPDRPNQESNLASHTEGEDCRRFATSSLLKAPRNIAVSGKAQLRRNDYFRNFSRVNLRMRDIIS